MQHRLLLTPMLLALATTSWSVVIPDRGDILDIIGDNPISQCHNLQVGFMEPEDAEHTIIAPIAPSPQTTSPVQNWNNGTVILGGTADGSVIDSLRLTHHHRAMDAVLGKVALGRVHSYRYTYRRSSFGPGVFSSFDTHLIFDGDRSMRIFNPWERCEILCADTKENDLYTGKYRDRRNNSIYPVEVFPHPLSAVLADIADDGIVTLTTTPDEWTAQSALITTQNGRRFLFEVIDMDDALGAAGFDGFGRLAHVFKPGSTTPDVSISYVHADLAATATAGVGPESQWEMASITDGTNSLTFEYTTNPVGGVHRAIKKAFINGGSHIRYRYRGENGAKDLGKKLTDAEIANLATDQNGNDIETECDLYGLKKVERSSTDISIFRLRLNWRSKSQVVLFDDPATLGNHPTKRAHYTLHIWWDHPDGTRAKRQSFVDATGFFTQSPGLVRVITDLDNTFPFYANWVGLNAVNGEPINFLTQEPDGFKVIEFKSVAGYPKRTAYSTDAFVNGKLNFDANGDPAMTFTGWQETYGHDTDRRVTRITSDDAARTGFISWDPVTRVGTFVQGSSN